uniref:Uncharacterized protein n=1 Tax=Rhizophora mucronata TaxID=61149 RepID=A0A2P2IJN2_RHIMU
MTRWRERNSYRQIVINGRVSSCLPIVSIIAHCIFVRRRWGGSLTASRLAPNTYANKRLASKVSKRPSRVNILLGSRCSESTLLRLPY